MASHDLRDRDASKRSLRDAIDGLDRAPSRKVRKARSRARDAQAPPTLVDRISPVHLAVALVGLTAILVGTVLL